MWAVERMPLVQLFLAAVLLAGWPAVGENQNERGSFEDIGSPSSGNSMLQSESVMLSGSKMGFAGDRFDHLADSLDSEEDAADSVASIQVGDAPSEPAAKAEASEDDNERDIAVFILDFLILAIVADGIRRWRARPSDRAEDAKEGSDSRTSGANATPEQFQATTKALRAGDEKSCLKLIKATPSVVRMEDIFGCTLLHYAAECRSVAATRSCLAHGADADAKEAWEESALHFAARSGSVEVCELLLAAGANIDPVNSSDMTPLLAAATAGEEATCELLLDRGATAKGVADDQLPPVLCTLMMKRMMVGQAAHATTASEEDSEGSGFPEDEEW